MPSKMYLAIIFSLLIFHKVIFPGTVTLQLDESGVIDCIIGSYNNYCYSNQPAGTILYYSSNSRWERYYCRIPLPEFVYGQTVTNATFKIFKPDQQTYGNQDFTLSVRRLTDELTQSIENTLGPVTLPNDTNVNSDTSDTYNSNYIGWIDFDFTSVVEGWLNSVYPNYGFLVRMLDESPPTQQWIEISQSLYPDSTKRPILAISGPSLPDTFITSGLGFPSTLNWLQQQSGTAETLNDIYFVSETDGFVCGNSGIILKTTNGGMEWSIQVVSGFHLNANSFQTPLNGITAGDGGAIFRTSNGGNTWNSVTIPANFDIQDTEWDDSGFIWITGSGGIAFKSSDFGNTWTDVSPPTNEDLNAVDAIGNTNVWIVGTNGEIWHTTDGGMSWPPKPPWSGVDFNDVQFLTPDIGFACGTNRTVITTTDGGESFSSLYVPINIELNGICFLDQSTGWTVGQNGTIYLWNNGWIQQNAGLNNELNKIFFYDSQNGWIVGEGGKILKYDNFTPIKNNSHSIPPNSLILNQNYPNPFNPVTIISYHLPTSSNVELSIYNPLGQRIRTLVKQHQPAGVYEIQWNGRDEHGVIAGSGVYIYRLKAGNFTRARKIVLLR